MSHRGVVSCVVGWTFGEHLRLSWESHHKRRNRVPFERKDVSFACIYECGARRSKYSTRLRSKSAQGLLLTCARCWPRAPVSVDRVSGLAFKGDMEHAHLSCFTVPGSYSSEGKGTIVPFQRGAPRVSCTLHVELARDLGRFSLAHADSSLESPCAIQ